MKYYTEIYYRLFLMVVAVLPIIAKSEDVLSMGLSLPNDLFFNLVATVHRFCFPSLIQGFFPLPFKLFPQTTTLGFYKMSLSPILLFSCPSPNLSHSSCHSFLVLSCLSFATEPLSCTVLCRESKSNHSVLQFSSSS